MLQEEGPTAGRVERPGRHFKGRLTGEANPLGQFRRGEKRNQEKTLPGKVHLKHISRVPGGRRAALGEPEKARTEETPCPGEEPGSHRQGSSAGDECYFEKTLWRGKKTT